MDRSRTTALALPLFRCAGSLRVLALCAFLCAALLASTVFGFLIAWLPIWVGLLLWRSATEITQAYDEGDEMAFVASLHSLGRSIRAAASAVLVGLAFAALLLRSEALAAGILDGLRAPES